MTTKKDLVEAHAFSRRRLVTAFLSGAPGGREVEPTRPGRTILGGVSIAVLLLAGAAIASVLAPRAPEDWKSQGVVITDQGARYIVTQDNGRLRPIINLTSAQLILGLDLQTQVVSQKTIDAAKEPPGDPIGIQGAPESLPTTSHFVESGWTACTNDGSGIVVNISATPPIQRLPVSRAFVVDSSTTGTWLIAQFGDESQPQAFRYRIPNAMKDGLLQRVFQSHGIANEITVPEEWLDLFPQGHDLDAAGFPQTGNGRPSKLLGQDGRQLTTGELASFGDRLYLVRPNGYLALTDFQAAVYGAVLDASHQDSRPKPMEGLDTPSHETMPATSWPTGLLDPATGPACSQLHAQNGQAPTVRIVTAIPGGNAWPDSPPKATDPPVQTVDPGRGAFVYSGSFGSPAADTPFMVDSRGGAYQLAGGSAIASLQLTDYRDHQAPVVPDSWINVLGRGTTLSTEQALCPPNTEVSGGSCAPGPS